MSSKKKSSKKVKPTTLYPSLDPKEPEKKPSPTNHPTQKEIGPEKPNDKALTPEKAPDQALTVKEQGKKKVEAKKVEVNEKRKFMEDLIQAGKYTAKEIAEKYVAKFDAKMSTAQTILTDGKNPKYNKFDKLVVADDKGIISFKK